MTGIVRRDTETQTHRERRPRDDRDRRAATTSEGMPRWPANPQKLGKDKEGFSSKVVEKAGP